MVKVKVSRQFRKHFRKRITSKKLKEKFYQRLDLFRQNSRHSLLKDHQLVGKMQKFRAFSITGDIRVVYSRESKNIVLLVDVGTHNQVYRY